MNNDEIDKLLYDYFKNLDKEIPLRIKNTIQNFQKGEIHKSENWYNYFRRIIILSKILLIISSLSLLLKENKSGAFNHKVGANNFLIKNNIKCKGRICKSNY